MSVNDSTQTPAATQTTDGQTASNPATTAPATGAGEGSQQQQAAGAGTEGTKPEGNEPEGGATGEAKPAGAPESYEFKAPEGVTFDPGVLGAFSEGAKEANLSQDAAQALLNKVAPVMQARQVEQAKALSESWAAEARADKEIGGDKFDENLATAKKALDSYTTPEFNQLLKETGLGNHPALVRCFFKIGQAMGEDKFVGGSTAPATAQSPGQRMFPNMNP